MSSVLESSLLFRFSSNKKFFLVDQGRDKMLNITFSNVATVEHIFVYAYI